jgi:hypothetical protein
MQEMFPVYDGKCMVRKAVPNWVEKFSQGRSKFSYDASPGVEVAETKVKRFLCCGFRRTDKAMGQMLSMFAEDMSRNTCFFSRFEYHIFYGLHPFVTYLLTPSYELTRFYFKHTRSPYHRSHLVRKTFLPQVCLLEIWFSQRVLDRERPHVLTAATMKSAVFCVVTPCSSPSYTVFEIDYMWWHMRRRQFSCMGGTEASTFCYSKCHLTSNKVTSKLECAEDKFHTKGVGSRAWEVTGDQLFVSHPRIRYTYGFSKGKDIPVTGHGGP